jgi:hypothetical protein
MSAKKLSADEYIEQLSAIVTHNVRDAARAGRSSFSFWFAGAQTDWEVESGVKSWTSDCQLCKQGGSGDTACVE